MYNICFPHMLSCFCFFFWREEGAGRLEQKREGGGGSSIQLFVHINDLLVLNGSSVIREWEGMRRQIFSFSAYRLMKTMGMSVQPLGQRITRTDHEPFFLSNLSRNESTGRLQAAINTFQMSSMSGKKTRHCLLRRGWVKRQWVSLIEPGSTPHAVATVGLGELNTRISLQKTGRQRR